ncbi:MAG: hypothetical protein AAF467_14960 [Actinomycetota bacterium]
MEPDPATADREQGPPKGVFIAMVLLVVASVAMFVFLVLSPLPLLIGLVGGVAVLAGASLLTVKMMSEPEHDSRHRAWSEGHRHQPPTPPGP